jgi:chromosome segregation ATPase
MDYMQDIMTRLQKGESVEDIAAQMTKDINAANAAFQEEKNKRAKLEPKRKAVRAALDAVANMFEVCFEDSNIAADLRELDENDLVDEIEKELPLIKMLAAMSDNPKPRAKDDKKSAADPIEDFLNKFVRN